MQVIQLVSSHRCCFRSVAGVQGCLAGSRRAWRLLPGLRSIRGIRARLGNAARLPRRPLGRPAAHLRSGRAAARRRHARCSSHRSSRYPCMRVYVQTRAREAGRDDCRDDHSRPELVGREAELRELAAYCTEPGRGPYVWWQAPAWAGKSALMSTFVLRRPAGVRVVAFFITARLGAQDAREAFTEVVLEQLAELLGQDLTSLTAATRDAHLLGMLEQAAEACAAQDERLILVLDGLDEDRGVTTGQDAYSIAALLPHDPPAGMRVVAAGRPDPPIPDDVPGWHRLRDPGIVRPLDSSAYAQDIRALAQRELRRLLNGTPAEQDLLGLLTAARGGHSVRRRSVDHGSKPTAAGSLARPSVAARKSSLICVVKTCVAVRLAEMSTADASGRGLRSTRKSGTSTPVGCQNSCRTSDLGFYPRQSCSCASPICSWFGCSAGWRCSPGATLPKTRRSWCCGTRSRSCAVRSRAQTGLGRPCGDRRARAGAAPAPAAAPDRDARHLAGLAPVPGQDEVDLPERHRAPADSEEIRELVGGWPGRTRGGDTGASKVSS